MPLPEDLAAQLLDCDGSCRDINFDRLDWHGAVAMVESLLSESSNPTATDGDGRSLDMADIGAAGICRCAQNTSSCHLMLTDVAQLFHSLQVFVCPDDDGSPFVELSFFPDDVLPTFTSQTLIDKVIQLATVGHANDFFVRYENASWEFGTTGEGTGVITTWHDIQIAR